MLLLHCCWLGAVLEGPASLAAAGLVLHSWRLHWLLHCLHAVQQHVLLMPHPCIVFAVCLCCWLLLEVPKKLVQQARFLTDRPAETPLAVPRVCRNPEAALPEA